MQSQILDLEAAFLKVFPPAFSYHCIISWLHYTPISFSFSPMPMVCLLLLTLINLSSVLQCELNYISYCLMNVLSLTLSLSVTPLLAGR